MRKTEVLRERLVEDAERVRKVHLPLDRHRTPATQPPGRACEVTETIHRDGGGFVERRHEKCGSEVREMVVNVMSPSGEALAREGLREQFFGTAASGARAQFLQHQRKRGTRSNQVPQLTTEIRARILVERHVLNVAKPDPALAQAVADRL